LLVYFFLVSIKLLGTSFKAFGLDFAKRLITTTANPFIGLFIGLLATSLIQSSSATTSILVGLVSSGSIPLQNAIPIVMGANIGTTVTNTFVSLAHITRKQEFKRAFSGAVIHDIFNLLAVAVFLPLQIATNFLGKFASFMAEKFNLLGGIKFTSPLKIIVKPTVKLVKHFLHHLFPDNNLLSNVIMLILALVILFISLKYLVSIARSLFSGKMEVSLHRYLFNHPFRSMSLGILFTALIQSSSVTTSLTIPLLGAGILTVEQIFPYVLGANVGTTVTAILASMVTGNLAAVAVAFSHLLFNIFGIAFWYPLKKLPLVMAHKLGGLAYNSRKIAFIYVLAAFYLIPLLLIFLTQKKINSGG
jgi:sodium-dependent phosphate cotransporter